MVIAGGSVMIPGTRGGSLREYLASLERLIGLSPAVLYPGHGPVIDRPVAVMSEYVAHRFERERQVLACLEAVGSDVDAIVARIYPGLDGTLRGAARMTVEAHLEKLREEGRLPRR
jgi:glyoxylase-like metal-dependent hydrolase (beta-lactamase superfamily II)